MPQKEDIFVSKKSSSAAEIEKNHAGGCLKKKAFLSKKVPARLRLQKSMVMDVAFLAYLKEKHPMRLFLYLI